MSGPLRTAKAATPARPQAGAVMTRLPQRPAAPAVVRTAMARPGRPLAADERAWLEPRFPFDFSVPAFARPASAAAPVVGETADPAEREADAIAERLTSGLLPARRPTADLSGVRVHTDAAAAASADALNADAYAVGPDLFFARNRFAPDSPTGRQLIAHELAHTFQDARTPGLPSVLRRRPPVGAAPPAVKSFWRRVAVKGEMNADDLLVEFVRQYNGLASTDEAKKVRTEQGWKWIGKPVTAGPQDKAKGYVLIEVTDRSLVPQDDKTVQENRQTFADMSGEEQDAINAETNRQFWNRTQYQRNGEFGNSPDDKKMAGNWVDVRDEVLRERREIDSLPPRIKDFLFTKDAPQAVTPRDYGDVLRLAQRLATLSDAELADYKAKVIGRTSDWRELDASVARYQDERARRRSAEDVRESKKTPLWGLKELYLEYKIYKQLSENSVHASDTSDMVFEAADARRKLNENLKRNGFESMEAFEQAIAAYAAVFQEETVAIALDVMAKYDHVLYEGEKQYADKAAAQRLGDAVAATKAKQHYQEAESEHSSAINFRMTPSGKKLGDEHQATSDRARETASSEVLGASGNDRFVADASFDRERLARAAPGEAQAVMVEYLHGKRESIASIRKKLADKPEFIYSLDNLLDASQQAQGIEPDSVFALIVRDKAKQVHEDKAFRELALGLFALAIGLVTAGTGTVAVLGAAAVAVVGGYQALQSYRDYAEQSAAADVKLLSQDPSFAWVIIAVVGAAADLGAAAAVLKSTKLIGAVKTFNAVGDVAQLEKDVKGIEGLTEAMWQSIAKGATSQKQYRAAVRAFGAKSIGRLNSVLIGPGGGVELAKAVYYAGKRGAVSFETLIIQLKAEKLLSETALEGEQLLKLKAAFEEARTAAVDVTTHGRTIGLDEDQVDTFIELWAKESRGPVAEVKADMSAFAATKQGGLPTRPVKSGTVIMDEQIIIAQRKHAGIDTKPMSDGERAYVRRMDELKPAEQRVTRDVAAKNLSSAEAVTITVARDSKEYKDVTTVLEKFNVGKGKGVEDRRIVADVFFAKTEPGTKAVFATADKPVYNNLARIAKIDPNKLNGKTVPQAFANGFDVTINGQTITVLPFPNR